MTVLRGGAGRLERRFGLRRRARDAAPPFPEAGPAPAPMLSVRGLRHRYEDGTEVDYGDTPSAGPRAAGGPSWGQMGPARAPSCCTSWDCSRPNRGRCSSSGARRMPCHPSCGCASPPSCSGWTTRSSAPRCGTTSPSPRATWGCPSRWWPGWWRAPCAGWRSGTCGPGCPTPSPPGSDEGWPWRGRSSSPRPSLHPRN